ncbi:phosphate acyltransferase PlsX [Candidatus Blochmannia ocreatus]|uniref:Phosphate acyltransferase n=1 Tax=Candidatus Blochmannia ocreatus (nom. nud.) TaxID=251538 RepID=A0ABY4STY8_9ENTR|nr:phosphate acyltransferase PlsX [Candidatus Blochmannia ocreatus]
MGGDFGPTVTVPAALEALSLHPTLKLLLVGTPAVIMPILSEYNKLSRINRLTVVPTDSVISSNIRPGHAIRISRNTSMRVALELISSGHADACVSAGNTGALMGLSKLILKSIDGIERPALTTLLPYSETGKTVILDLGANIVCNGEMLVQFAIMGSVLSEQILGINNPRVALLNIGSEETKGLDNIRYASKILHNIPLIRYIGYIEANDLLMGKSDVLVCDGFSGNITLKTMEGVIRIILSTMKLSGKQYNKLRWFTKLIRFLLNKYFFNKFSRLHPDWYNGAHLVGLKSTVIKSHGAANRRAFVSAIKQAIHSIECRVPEKIFTRLRTVLSKKDS